jgi:hypothetical protein
MDTLFYVIIAALAVGYLTELVGVTILDSRILRGIMTPILSYFACWLLDLTGFTLAVAGCSAAFLATAITALLNRVLSSPQVINRR